MNRSVRFWTLLAVFQVAFGLTVFGLTRNYYLEHVGGEGPAPPPTSGAVHPMPTVPADTPQDDLARLIATFPGPAGQAGPVGDATGGPTGDPTGDVGPVELARQGDLAFGGGEYARAAELYARALAAGDEDVNTYNRLGLTLHYLGRSGEALQVLGEGVGLDAGYQRIWLTLGFVHGQVGHPDQAREALERAWDMDPESDVGRAAADMLKQFE
ncbi:MAG: tetratricopeptide repeat protein [Xanthomonadales bacterium]|nr:tetratricopeptide repeat protein [Xanthomonadales bacterium]